MNSEQLTADLRQRLAEDRAYAYDEVLAILPLEPMVKVSEIIEPYTNLRALQTDKGYVIPIATYHKGVRQHYTTFEECKQWAAVYGIENVFVGSFSDYLPDIESEEVE